MKLSEVTRAGDLQELRQSLVKAFVAVGSGFGWAGSRVGGCEYKVVFGFRLDDQMDAALRIAARSEIRRRIEVIDAEFADLGVEVDGIDVAIEVEENLQGPREAVSA